MNLRLSIPYFVPIQKNAATGAHIRMSCIYLYIPWAASRHQVDGPRTLARPVLRLPHARRACARKISDLVDTMPAVDIAMRRSLGDGFVDLLVASLRPAFERRDGITNIPGKVTDVKTAFSSWDNCMKASYCKWPVIAILVIGGLMIFSVLWCIIRKNKYLDEPFIPPDPGYKSQDPMFATGATLPAVSHASAASDTPQFAQFRVSKKGAQSGNDDALPAMPSWEGSESKKVLVEEESVEMSDLKRPEAIGANQGLAAGLHLVSPNPSHGYAGHYEQNRPYAGAAPERQYSSDSMRPLRPTVSTQQRQYSDDSQAVSSPFSHVSGGFDFSTDDSRSVAQSTRGARGYAGRPSLSREQTQAAAYNGYRMY
ncbi:hypothetical protein P8C59_006997 [Phyllachora maydis]|uniref:Uncharacterized protein n=1 Tax=Phyllachora maydis TaxID=1825666 RepID=A0AAD9MD36_9PEZI|nr:hypothetical protein P8C59_006997 [Phyllachora maydis]